GPSLIRLLGPGGADLCASHKDAVGGGVVLCRAGFGDDADVLGLDRKSDDLAIELVAGLLEGADGGHFLVLLDLLVSSLRHCGVDGDRRARGERRFTRRAETEWRMAARGLSCSARNDGAAGKGRKSGG